MDAVTLVDSGDPALRTALPGLIAKGDNRILFLVLRKSTFG